MKRLNNVYMEELKVEGGDLGGDGGDPAPVVADGGDPAVIDPSVSDPAVSDNSVSDPAPTDFFSTVPEDWRVQALKKAGYEEGDDYNKALKQLDRVSDLGVLTKNYLSAQDKIRKGEVSNGLPENPTDEQIAEYREANGVPATPSDYQLELEDGLVLGEADEAVMGAVYEAAHADNVPSSTLSKMTNAMLKSRELEAEARISQDGIDTQMTSKQLKDAWGGDFATNNNMVKGLLNQLPESVKDSFMNARLSDGKAVFNSPEVMIAMAEWARKINPSATVVPNSVNPMQTMNEEIKQLESRMGTNEWYKDKEANDRLEALYTARNNMNSQ